MKNMIYAISSSLDAQPNRKSKAFYSVRPVFFGLDFPVGMLNTFSIIADCLEGTLRRLSEDILRKNRIPLDTSPERLIIDTVTDRIKIN